MARKKEADFFELLKEEMKYASNLSKSLKELLSNLKNDGYNGDLKECLENIHKIEHQGDEVQSKIVYELNCAFITPIDREDIFTIAENIDKASNEIEDVAFRFWMFDIKRLREDIVGFVELICKCCDKAEEILSELPNYKKSKSLFDLIKEMYSFEHQGDEIYRNAVRKLFVGEQNPVEIQKWRELYHNLENCFDSCREIAASVERAAIKNS